VTTLILILILNTGISYWNAYVCGKSWVESKALGGKIRFLVWCGAVQSAMGFSALLIFPLIFLAHSQAPNYFTDVYFNGAISLWYLSVIFPVLGTGFAITIESWVAAYRDQSLLNMGAAAWNSFAAIHNAGGAVEGVGTVSSVVGNSFGSAFDVAKGGDDPRATFAIMGLLIMLAIVAIALIGGVWLTAIIIRRYAGAVPLPARNVAYAM
jgi:hypothetical protein